jgi:hypothetical protein
MKMRKIAYLAGLAISGVIASQAANATEGGGSIYPMGAENFLSGALPPPGFYPLVYLNHYSADKLKDNNGDTVPLNFKVTANVIAPRLIWVTGHTLFGGQVGHALMLPLVDLDVKVGTASQNKTGIGDLNITPLVLGYHHNPNLHSIVALDIFAPTGRFNKTDMTNIGRESMISIAGITKSVAASTVPIWQPGPFSAVLVTKAISGSTFGWISSDSFTALPSGTEK